MANFITQSFSATYSGKDIVDELFYAPQEGSDDLMGIRKMNNVKTKVNMYLPATLNKIVRKYSTCGFTATGSAIDVSDKTLEVSRLKVNLEQCGDTFYGTVWEEFYGSGTAVDDLTDTIVGEIARKKVAEGIRDDNGRIAWFAASTAVSADYNQFDGFVQLFVADSAALGQYVEMTAISNVEDTNGDLVADGAYELMKYAVENQTKVLRQMPNSAKSFRVTSTIIDNLTTTYEQLGTGNNLGLSRLIDGQGNSTLTFRGVPVLEIAGWDTQLADAANPNSGGNGINIGSNLMIYTVNDNLVLGSDVTDPQAQLKFRSNDDDDELLKIIAKYKMGAQFVHGDLVSMYF
jgi:hypothetical protein